LYNSMCYALDQDCPTGGPRAVQQAASGLDAALSLHLCGPQRHNR